MTPGALIPMLENAIEARASLFDARHETAFRLFNGFFEGNPDLVVDLYASTLVIHNYADDPAQGRVLAEQAGQFLQDALSWLRAGIVKTRNGKTQEEKRGQLIFGEKPDTKIKEHGVSYSIDLMMNRDASFYLDTRTLRKWLIDHTKIQTNGRLGINQYTMNATTNKRVQIIRVIFATLELISPNHQTRFDRSRYEEII